MLSFVVAMSLKGQVYVQGGAGMAFNKEIGSLTGQIETGWKQPLNTWGGSGGGLMASGGFVALVDASAPVIFYLKGGKAFQIGYGQEIELSGGYSWSKVSNDDKSRNSSGAILSISLLNQVSEIGQWVVNLSGGKGFVSGSIGMRINFINYKKY